MAHARGTLKFTAALQTRPLPAPPQPAAADAEDWCLPGMTLPLPLMILSSSALSNLTCTRPFSCLGTRYLPPLSDVWDIAMLP